MKYLSKLNLGSWTAIALACVFISSCGPNKKAEEKAEKAETVEQVEKVETVERKMQKNK